MLCGSPLHTLQVSPKMKVVLLKVILNIMKKKPSIDIFY